MAIPWLPFSAIAASSSFALTHFGDVSRAAAAKLFAAFFAGELLAYGIYSALIYPFYVSPLRHLPMPKGNHWLFGHALTIVKEPTANPAKRW